MPIIIPNPPVSEVVSAETAVNRRNTAAFIAADPIVLTLTSRNETMSASGGRVWQDGESRPDQVFRLIPSQDRTPELRTSDGRMVKPEFTLLGVWDAEMERWDKFEFEGVSYQIVTPIRPEHTSKNVYQRKGDVVRIS